MVVVARFCSWENREHHTSSSSSSSALPHLLGTKLDRRHLSFISGSVYLNSFIISGLRYDFTSRAESLKVSRVTTSPVTEDTNTLLHHHAVIYLCIHCDRETPVITCIQHTAGEKISHSYITNILTHWNDWIRAGVSALFVPLTCSFTVQVLGGVASHCTWASSHTHQQHYMTLLSTSPWLPIVPSLPVTLQRTFLVTHLVFCCAACYVPVARRDHLNKLK